MDFHLFRIKAFLTPLLRQEITPAAVVRGAIEQKPTIGIGAREVSWHIGNVEPLDDNGLYFRLGRTSLRRVPMLDPVTGDFVEQDSETAPYTHVVLDVPFEVCAIAHTGQLAASVVTLGNNLGKLLQATAIAREYAATFEVSPIQDPGAFIEHLRAAYAIRRFTMSFTKPNPIDPERDFQGPMTRLAQELRAERGSATVKGESLEEGGLETLARSAAATGDDASARIQPQRGQRTVTRRLRGETASVSEDDAETGEQKRSALGKTRAKYRQVRGPEEG